jgi:hypothetical protein
MEILIPFWKRWAVRSKYHLTILSCNHMFFLPNIFIRLTSTGRSLCPPGSHCRRRSQRPNLNKRMSIVRNFVIIGTLIRNLVIWNFVPGIPIVFEWKWKFIARPQHFEKCNPVLEFLNNLWGLENRRVRIGISYRPASPHRLAVLILCNRFLGCLKVLKFVLWL